ncbi:hypothetical protein EVAR_63475_1 [Eumeta japonica]|uniref:Uncharacterized protein n=1 Tax=Eumeta variegata TaxID=151549 RepID=A0A4C1YD64_EUMVA|nr:hypothetical protein EVAR_63475_1 [Eumeta japonica]
MICGRTTLRSTWLRSTWLQHRNRAAQTKEAGNALVTSPGLREFMSGGDHLFSDGSPAGLPFKPTVKIN